MPPKIFFPLINREILLGVVLFIKAFTGTVIAQVDNTPMLRPQIVVGGGGELIRHLEERSGWVISYSSRLCITDRMRLSSEEKTLLQHLQILFAGCQIEWEVRGNRIILKPATNVPRTYTVSGFVREWPSRESLPFTNVFNRALGIGTVTNNYGFYSITLPAGYQSLSASFVGYLRKVEEFYLSRDTVINFNLSASIELSEVAVVGQQYDQYTYLTRTGAVIMPIDQIRQFPAMFGETDLVKSIQMLPGIQGGNEGFSGLFVRGGGPDQNLILLDDIPVYNIGHLLGFLSVFNPEAIRHVSVLKGGFPARFGGRLSSVVDVRMMEGNNEKIKGSASLGLLSSGLSINGPLVKDRTAFALSFRRSYLDLAADLIQRGRDETTNYFFYDLNARVNHTFNNRHRIFLSTYLGRDRYVTRYNFQSTTTGNPEMEGSEITTIINDRNHAGWGNFVTGLRWNFIISPKLFSNLTATYSDYRFFIGVQRENQVNDQLDIREQRYLSGIQDFGLKIDFDYFPAIQHLVKFGASATWHDFNPGIDIIRSGVGVSQPVDTLIGEMMLTGGEYHAYIENEFTIANRLRVNAGARFILFRGENKLYYSLEPRLALFYELTPAWDINASYSEMSQYIHMIGSSSVALPTDLWLPVTDKIPPMRAHQVSLGNQWRLGGPGAFSLGLEFYYKQLFNLLMYKESTGFFDYSNEWEDKLTTGKGFSYGAELMLRKNRGALTGWLGYTFARTTNQFDDINNGQPFPARFDRRHDISLSLNYRFNERVDGGATWQFGSGMPFTLPTEKFFAPDFPFLNQPGNQGYSETHGGINSFRMPPFHRLDIGFNFSKEKPRWVRTWSVGVINVYSRQNPFMLYFARDANNVPGQATQQLKQLSLFPFPIPYIKYTIRF